MKLLPASVILPTLGRRERLQRTVASVLAQDSIPCEIIIVDASRDAVTVADLPTLPPGVVVQCLTADRPGAATQRNQGFRQATQPFVLFLDNDVDLAPGCLSALWQALAADPAVGGVGVLIDNQAYHPPGRVLRRLYYWLGCPPSESLAGRCCGPALNFLPGRPDAGHGRVDWLNLCCTLYRREALPSPPLHEFFQGYSLLEDAALSLQIGKTWRLLTAAGAVVRHDSQPADYKNRVFRRERMETVNRWFVMRTILGRESLAWDLRQGGFQILSLLLPLRTLAGWRRFPAAAAGRLSGFLTVIRQRRLWQGYLPSSP